MIRRVFDALLGWIPRSLHAALSLSGEQRQTLMSWGLLGGVVVITARKFLSQRTMEARWAGGLAPDVERILVEGLFAQLTWDTLLQAALVLGVVAIARGGSMTMSVTKGGVTVDFQASGQAAKQLATDTSLSEAMTPAAEPTKQEQAIG